MGLFDAHAVEGIIIIQFQFDYLDSLSIKRRKKLIWGIHPQEERMVGRF